MSQQVKRKLTQSVVKQDMTQSPLVQNTHILATNKMIRLLEQTQNALVSITKATEHPRETVFICVSLCMSALHSTGMKSFIRVVKLLAGIQEAMRRQIEREEIKKAKPIIEKP